MAPAAAYPGMSLWPDQREVDDSWQARCSTHLFNCAPNHHLTVQQARSEAHLLCKAYGSTLFADDAARCWLDEDQPRTT